MNHLEIRVTSFRAVHCGAHPLTLVDRRYDLGRPEQDDERNHGMRYNNENEIKQALGIESWRNITKDKMIRFAAMMPDMDSEVALKIVEQFPVFKKFAVDAINALEKAHKSTLSANKQSQGHVHKAFQEIREILKEELKKDGLSQEERKYIIEQIQETGRLEIQKDSENKHFLDGMFKKLLTATVVTVALGVAFVGGKIVAESNDSPEDSLDA